MSTHSPASFQQITDVLSQSLRQAFEVMCPKRYGAALKLNRIDDPTDDQTVSFTLEGPDTPPLHIGVTITHVGGNVYDIATQVEDGDVRRFTYSEPAASGSSLSIAPYLGKKIAEHLLDTVEQRLGKKILQDQMELEAA
mgnify:CR=1 FL=1